MLREASMRLGALAMPKINIWPPTLLIGGGQVITSTPFWPLMTVLRKVFPPYPPQGQMRYRGWDLATGNRPQ